MKMQAAVFITVSCAIGTALAQAPAAPAVPAAAAKTSALPEGFGQIEAQLRFEVDPAYFQTNYTTLSKTGNSPYGEIKYVTGQTNSNLFTLPRDGLSQGLIKLDGCALWAPHYHPRASEILFVTQGTVSMGFAEENNVTVIPVSGTPTVVGGRNFSYTVGVGSSLVVPQGLVHYVYNGECGPASIVTAFDNKDPGVVSITQRLFGFDETIISTAIGLPRLTVQLAKPFVDASPIISLDSECAAKCPAGGAPQAAPAAG